MDHRERVSEEDAARNLADLLTRVRDEGATQGSMPNFDVRAS
jgi:hypothetical protein